MPSFDLSDRVAIVTGGSQGFGKAIALAAVDRTFAAPLPVALGQLGEPVFVVGADFVRVQGNHHCPLSRIQ